MSLKDQLKDDMKTAMKAKEEGKLALSVIRMVNSAIKNLEIDSHKELGEDEILTILAKEVKMRQDSIEGFMQGGRNDLVEQAKKEIEILQKYLPEQLTEDEIRSIVKEALALCAQPYKMGDVMAAVMPHVKGKADGKMVNRIVKEEIA